MAKWTDANGVYHDTDNLAYGDQGDTRYWDGKPGTEGSVAYDRPKDDPGANPAYIVTVTGGEGSIDGYAAPVIVPFGGGDSYSLTASGPQPLPGSASSSEEGSGTLPAPGGSIYLPAMLNGHQLTDMSGFPLVWKDGALAQDPNMGGTNVYQAGKDVVYAGGQSYLWLGENRFAALGGEPIGGTGSSAQPSTQTSSGGSGGSYGVPGTTGLGGSTQKASTQLSSPGLSTKVQGWVQANPLLAVAGAAVVGSMVLGGGKRRW